MPPRPPGTSILMGHPLPGSVANRTPSAQVEHQDILYIFHQDPLRQHRRHPSYCKARTHSTEGSLSNNRRHHKGGMLCCCVCVWYAAVMGEEAEEEEEEEKTEESDALF